MTDRLDEIQARLEAATPGPWGVMKLPSTHPDAGKPYVYTRNDVYPEGHVQDVFGGVVCIFSNGDPDWPHQVNAELVANAPTDIAWLLDEIERQRGELDTMARLYLQTAGKVR